MMDTTKKIFVTGHKGLVGSAICRALTTRGFENVVTVDRSEVDLRDPVASRWFFSVHRPAYVFHCAAWVGGIMAHTNHSTDAILANLAIQNNVISLAHVYGAEKLLFLGSACAYPKDAACPILEDALGTGRLEPSNAGYALCKILGTELCNSFRREHGKNFITAIPTNVYGLNDNYHFENSHVLPGMIQKIHSAKIHKWPEVVLWGTGNPLRDFVWSDDLAEACLLLMHQHNSAVPVNVGTGTGIRLRYLAGIVAQVVGYGGDINWDLSKPDGTPVRFLDVSKMSSLGWSPRTPLVVGVEKAYQDFRSRQ